MASVVSITPSVLPDRDKLYRFALSLLHNMEEAEDVAQEVLLRLWDQRQQWPEISNLEAWAMRMTRNLALDRIKARKYRSHASTEGLEVAEVALQPDARAELNEALQRVHQLIAGLPTKQRMIIQLRDIEGHSYQEIAEIMEISLSKVKVYLHRARKRLRKGMEKLEGST